MAVMITRYGTGDKATLLEIWEESVRATHHFLQPVDIELYKSILQGVDFSGIPVFFIKDIPGKAIGFISITGQKLDMLFLRPAFFRRGYGKQLISFARSEFNINRVDVNEDNTTALKFYKQFGFTVLNRKPIDHFGKPYPILEMVLANHPHSHVL
jgi:putative acetyltransferase